MNFLYLIVQLLFDLCAGGGVFCNILVSYELQFNFLNLSLLPSLLIQKKTRTLCHL
jgi:hypothetical protein